MKIKKQDQGELIISKNIYTPFIAVIIGSIIGFSVMYFLGEFPIFILAGLIGFEVMTLFILFAFVLKSTTIKFSRMTNQCFIDSKTLLKSDHQIINFNEIKDVISNHMKTSSGHKSYRILLQLENEKIPLNRSYTMGEVQCENLIKTIREFIKIQ